MLQLLILEKRKMKNASVRKILNVPSEKRGAFQYLCNTFLPLRISLLYYKEKPE